jgi:AraC-like DNA-binding protein
MDISPECQTIALRPGAIIHIETVNRGSGAAPQRRYNHFHPACEIVWFRRANGWLLADGAATSVEGGQIVFLPSMHVHDFDMAPGPHFWVLLQFEPFMLGSMMQNLVAEKLRGAFIARPDVKTTARLDALFSWLEEIATQPAHAVESARLLDLILTLVARADDSNALIANKQPGSLDRIRPVVDLVHNRVRDCPGLEEAAALCNLSPFYFSRQFKAHIGMGYADYVQMHRLNVAARLVLMTDQSLAQIAYAVGFATPSYFSTSFSERFGTSPRLYRSRGKEGSPYLRDDAQDFESL